MSSSDATADPQALFKQAIARLHGLDGPQDLAAAHALFRKAAGKGHAPAARARANLIAAGIGCRADPAEAKRLLAKLAGRDGNAAAQLELLRTVPEPPEPRRHAVNAAPEIVLVERLLAPEECRWLIAKAEPRVEPSWVGHPVTGERMLDPIRTSHGCNFGPAEEDLVLNRINRRVARVTGTRYEAGEPLHMLRYQPGQEYRPHLDVVTGATNQRIWTALIYLNGGYKGGATAFPLLDLSIEGAPGDALLFRSLDADGRPDPLTRHAGLPVTSGVKWLATRWIRQLPHNPWAP